jgi:hypothetical protein
VSRLGLPAELRRSLACTNIIENMMGTVRRVTRNVKRWSSPSPRPCTKPRRAFAGQKPSSNFRPYEPLSLRTTKRKQTTTLLPKKPRPLNVIHGSARSAKFNRARGNSPARSLRTFLFRARPRQKQMAVKRPKARP